MEFPIHEIRTNKAGFNQLAQLYAATADLCFGEVALDFSGCTWFDANMSAPLGAVLARITDELNDVNVKNLPVAVQDILSKNEFLHPFKIDPVPDAHGTVVPYRRFRLDDGRYFAAYVHKYTNGKGIPNMTTMLRRKFNEGIGELFSNAVIHSESRLGVFSCGQFYPKKKCFDFCLADSGSGFQGAIKKAFDLNVDSVRAMQHCLREGFTTKKTEPGGLGLKLLKKFIELNQGRIVIVSNQAYYEFSKGSEVFQALDQPFPGTCINIEIDTADTKNYRLSSEPPNQP